MAVEAFSDRLLRSGEGVCEFLKDSQRIDGHGHKQDEYEQILLKVPDHAGRPTEPFEG